jgi:hypothetical protein
MNPIWFGTYQLHASAKLYIRNDRIWKAFHCCLSSAVFRSKDDPVELG